MLSASRDSRHGATPSLEGDALFPSPKNSCCVRIKIAKAPATGQEYSQVLLKSGKRTGLSPKRKRGDAASLACASGSGGSAGAAKNSKNRSLLQISTRARANIKR